MPRRLFHRRWLVALALSLAAIAMPAAAQEDPAAWSAWMRLLAQGQPPPPPPGTERVVSYDQHANKIAACAEKAGPGRQEGARRIAPTEVWITDGTAVWKTATGLGTCDPRWSPDGQRLAVTAPDGLWVLAGERQSAGERLVEAAASGPTEFGSTTIGKPAWSPNGTRIGYVASNGGTSWVEVVEVGTGKIVFKSRPETYEFSWGDDSRSLAIGAETVRIP